MIICVTGPRLKNRCTQLFKGSHIFILGCEYLSLFNVSRWNVYRILCTCMFAYEKRLENVWVLLMSSTGGKPLLQTKLESFFSIVCLIAASKYIKALSSIFPRVFDIVTSNSLLFRFPSRIILIFSCWNHHTASSVFFCKMDWRMRNKVWKKH